MGLMADRGLLVMPGIFRGPALGGLRWQLPGLSDNGAGAYNCPATATVGATMDGAPGTAYTVSLRFRGVVETMKYTGGSNDGAFFQTGGTPLRDGSYTFSTVCNSYRLTIEGTVYYLNRATDGVYVRAVDYTKSFTIHGGGYVELFADSVDSAELKENDAIQGDGSIIIANGFSRYTGQFIQMDVASIS